MAKTAIITDTDCSLPVELAQEYGIIQVPINVHFGQETLAAVKDLNDDQLISRIDRDGKLPTTSAPSPGSFLEAYETAFNSGADEVVCFTVSSKVSAVFNAAVSAKELLPDKKIRVIDSESLSMGQGFMVLAAAEAAQKNKTSDEIITMALQTGKRAHLYAALATLKYLAMSGRVGYLAAGIANILDIRPILTLKDGKLDLLEKARTKRKSWNRVIELTKATSDGKGIDRMAILHVNAPDLASQFQNQFCEAVPCPANVITTELTPGLSVHTGAGVVGVAFLVNEF